MSGLVSCYSLRLFVGGERESSSCGGNVGIAGGDFQGATGSGISTAFRVAAHQMRSESNGYRAVQVLVNGHGLAGQRMFPATLLDLPPAIADSHGVVLTHNPFRVDREDPIQIPASAFTEGRSLFRRRHGKVLVELLDVVLAEETVGLLQIADAGQAQLLRQAPLPGGVVAFHVADREVSLE